MSHVNFHQMFNSQVTHMTHSVDVSQFLCLVTLLCQLAHKQWSITVVMKTVQVLKN